MHWVKLVILGGTGLYWVKLGCTGRRCPWPRWGALGGTGRWWGSPGGPEGHGGDSVPPPGRMRGPQRALCLLLVASASLAALYLHLWAPKDPPIVDLRRPPPERLPPPLPPSARAYPHVPFRLKEEVME